MINSVFRKALALILLLSLLLSSSAILISCGDKNEPENPEEAPTPPEVSESYLDKLIKPEFKDYGRGTIDFSKIVYSRPDFTKINNACAALTEKVKSNSSQYSALKKELEELDDAASNVLTMYSFSRIYNSKDSSVKYWVEEYEYISKHYSGFVKYVEELKVTCANSPHAESFEKDFFGDGFIEEYKDGSDMSDEEALLLADEAALTAQYNSISTATIEITYLGKTDTVDNILEFHKQKYGEGSPEYLAAENSCLTLYYEKYYKEAKLILIELFKVRSKIATESGYDNYIEYCYSERDLDYTPEDTSKLLSDIAEYVLPVYINLYSYAFYYYFSSTEAKESSFDTTVNTSYKVLKSLSPELHSIFSYMLQHGLFDLDSDKNQNRDEGAYTIYLHDYSAPFIFMTGKSNVLDYSTLFHEFGHFADFYINDGDTPSTDVAEISSQALEMLVLDELSKTLGKDQETYLLYTSFKNALETLAYQGFYARFEESAYKLSYDEITEESLNAIILDCADEFKINTQVVNTVETIIIPHFITNPVYVHSYCTSIIPALEIFFLEEEEKGEGFDAYMDIISRDGSDNDFLSILAGAGLTSPFEAEYMKELADKIHYRILGSHFYTSEPPSQVA